MKNQETRGMHFVPEAYLQNFSDSISDEEPKVAFYDKHKGGGINLTSPSNLCKKRDIYRLEGETIEERQYVEDFYHKFTEERYYQLYNLLTDDSCHKISEVEHERILLFVITLLFRTQKLISTYNNFLIESFSKAHEIAKQHGLDSFRYGDDVISFKDKTVIDLVKAYGKENNNKRVPIQITAALNLFRYRKDDPIRLIKIENKEFSYLTSDNPVTFSNRATRYPSYFDLESELSVAIDSHHKLYVYPKSIIPFSYGFSKKSYSNSLAKNETTISNFGQLLNSERFLIGNKKETINETLNQFNKINK